MRGGAFFTAGLSSSRPWQIRIGRCLAVFFLVYLLTGEAPAGDEPFTGPANWGGTGLMEIPTARVLQENTYRIGVGQIAPYRYYYGAFSPLKGLEIDGRITEVLGVPASSTDPDWQNYGNYKDKSVDLKYQFVGEGKYLPAMAVGIMDPHGTRIYSSQYIVFSKQIYPFDFTVGLGNGRFGKRPLPSQGEGLEVELFSDKKGWLDDARLFWGVQFTPNDRWSLMLENNPIEYHKQTSDPATKAYFGGPVASRYNIGLRYNLYNWAELALSYQRGDQVGFNLSMPFEIGRPMIPLYDPPYRESPQAAMLPIERRIAIGLSLAGFSSIGVTLEVGRLTIDLQNNKYFYSSRAVEVILATIASMIRDFNAVPGGESIGEIALILKENGVPLYTFRTQAGDVLEYEAERLGPREFYALTSIDTGYTVLPKGRKEMPPGFVLGYKPQFQLFLNDPSGFWKGKLGLSLWASHPLWEGGSLTAGVAAYPFTNVETVNAPLSIPVRTDIVNYMRNKALLERALFSQINRIPDTSFFTRLSAGLLETQYAGLDAESALPLFGGRLLLGLGGSLVKKRDPDNPVGIAKDQEKDFYKTAFLNTRLNFPGPEISVEVKYGMFLAGDKGAKVTFSKFIKGVTLSAWYTVTDTSVFTDPINRGYRDKGVFVLIPIRLFTGHDSRAVYGQGISPWTRDVGQDIEHFTSLFDLLGRNTEVFLKKDLDKGRLD